MKFLSRKNYEFFPNVSNKQENKTLICNWLHQRSEKNTRSFSLQYFHGLQENWGSDQCEQLESISGFPSFQDGKSSNSKELDAAYHSVNMTPDDQGYLAFLWMANVMFIVLFLLGWVQLQGCLQKSQNWFYLYSTESSDSSCYVFRQPPDFERTRTDCLLKVKKVMTLLKELGFTINIKNSI